MMRVMTMESPDDDIDDWCNGDGGIDNDNNVRATPKTDDNIETG